MPVLPPIHLPLPPTQPPQGFLLARSISERSDTSTAFNTGLDVRDENRCVVCGDPEDVEHCHIIPKSEPETWQDLVSRNYVPATAKPSVKHEPRNGILLCATHHKNFNAYRFFIRYIPEQRKFVFINYNRASHRAIFPWEIYKFGCRSSTFTLPLNLFIHEMRVRGHNPFALEPDDISPMVEDQDWIREEISNAEHDAAMNPESSMMLLNPITRTTDNGSGNSSGGPPAGTLSLALNADVIQKILSATRQMASWKAYVQEGTSWDGTAEENIAKYKSMIEL